MRPVERGRHTVQDNPDPRASTFVDGGIKGAQQGHDVFPTDGRMCGAGKDRGKRLLVPGVHEKNGTIGWNPVKREGFSPDNVLACSCAYMATQQTKTPGRQACG